MNIIVFELKMFDQKGHQNACDHHCYVIVTGKLLIRLFNSSEIAPWGFTLVICSLRYNMYFCNWSGDDVGQVLPISCHPVLAAMMVVFFNHPYVTIIIHRSHWYWHLHNLVLYFISKMEKKNQVASNQVEATITHKMSLKLHWAQIHSHEK